MKYQIAVAQIDTGDRIEENMKKIREAVRAASETGAKLIAFPEKAEYIGPDYAGHAQPIPGMITTFFSGLAKEHGIYIHCGSITAKKEEANPTNTSLLFNSEGKLIASYSKLHMFDISLDDGTSYQESGESSQGEEIVLCETTLGCLGMAICYDLRFGELFRLQAMHGAQILFVPAEFTHNTGKDHWETLLRARAIENTCYVVAPDQCGEKPGFAAHGNSIVIDPWGNILARAGEQEEILYAEIDTDRIQEVRRQLPSLKNRREDIYRLSSEHLHIYREE